MSFKEKILRAFDVRYFAKDVIKLAEGRDPVDCIQDLELVIRVLKAEMEGK